MALKPGKIQYNAPVTLTFTFIAFVVLMLGEFTGHTFTKLFFTNYSTSFTDPLLYFRVFSHVLGHISWEHFSGNFLIILLLGPILEEKYGSKVMVEMILITALVTGLLNMLFFNTGLLGASGVVFMLILLSSFANAQAGRIPLTLILVIIIFIGKEVVNGMMMNDSISQMAHIIGGLCGCVFGYRIEKK